MILCTECTQPHTLSILTVDVKKKLEKLNINKSPDQDSIHPRIIKELGCTVSLPLATFVINTETELHTNGLEGGQISAIYKKRDKKQAGNYRPVSLTSIICRIIESLVRDSIIEYMVANSLFSDKLYDFINGRINCIAITNSIGLMN